MWPWLSTESAGVASSSWASVCFAWTPFTARTGHKRAISEKTALFPAYVFITLSTISNFGV